MMIAHVLISHREDRTLYDARTVLLDIAARAGAVGDTATEAQARRLFSGLVDVTAMVGQDYTRDGTGIAGAVVDVTDTSRAPSIFCGECGNLISRGPFTVIKANDGPETQWLCSECTEVFGLIVGHDYASGECPCHGDARAHGYLNADGE